MRPAALAALYWAALTALQAQTASTATTPDNPAPAAQLPAAPPAAPAKDEPVQMDPFSVVSASGNSYSALNSNSITRFNTELNKMPLTADIFDSAFMSDIGATSVEGMLEAYSPGFGFAGNDPGASAGASAGDHVSHATMMIRGYTVPYMMRDSLMPVGSFFNPGATGSDYTSTFDLERVEVILGPQQLMYSSGGGGGVVNTVEKQARLGAPDFATLDFQMDQYGSKTAQLDVGMGSPDFAVRFTGINQNLDTRRINVAGGALEGYFLQVAAKFFGNTTVRISGEQTNFNQLVPSYPSLTALGTGTGADARNGDKLAYLLATGQVGAAANGGASGAGPIDNGLLTWANVNSFAGATSENLTTDTFVLGQVDTTWNSWLSTQLSAGYNDFFFDLATETPNIYAPNATSNPLPGNWTASDTPNDLTEPGRAKAIRFIALLTNDFFGGRAHSQTIIGGDFLRQDAGQFSYNYFYADSIYNPTINATTTYEGRTLMLSQPWSIANGPVLYPLPFLTRDNEITINGQNYVRQLENPSIASLVTPANPMGVTGTNGTYEVAKAFNQGYFVTNDTEWFGGKLDTVEGFRLEHFFTQTQLQGTADVKRPHETDYDFDVGVNYELFSWLRPYIGVSNTYYPPEEKGNDVIGDVTPTSSAVGEEGGFKFNTADNRFSGELAFYHTSGKNEQYEVSTTIENDINPPGLNGQYAVTASPSQWVYVSREAEGAELILTANPTPNWRFRLGASDVGGTIESASSFSTYYNDQFHENTAGDVTYADGSLVYVAPKYSASSPTVSSSSAGAAPLTVAMMNNPASVYYANPVNPSGQINTGSAVYNVLKTVDPVHGAIATGVAGLPISDIQITPPFAVATVIPVTAKGDHDAGTPELIATFTSVYSFDKGWLKGFEAGGTISMEAENYQDYYFPTGVTNSLARSVFTLPADTQFDLIVGYTRKFRKVTFSSQLNVSNLFNHYDVIIVPSEVTGYSVAANMSAKFSQEPRAWLWTNTIGF
jgi:outer membrane receptor protein involved in Fe transport